MKRRVEETSASEGPPLGQIVLTKLVGLVKQCITTTSDNTLYATQQCPRTTNFPSHRKSSIRVLEPYRNGG